MPDPRVIVLLAVLLGVPGLLYVRRRLRWKTLHPLLPERFNFGKRRDTFRRAMELLQERAARTLLETGVAREGLERTKEDGASTVVFAQWASLHGAVLHAIDLDGQAIDRAAGALAELGLESVVTFHQSDSVAFLRTFEHPVDFLYLDSYDYGRHDPAQQRASQRHHLAEFEAIEGRLHERSVVLIDDCRQPGGGKGKLVIERMLASGWRIDRKAYQVLLVRAASSAASAPRQPDRPA